MNDTMLGRLRDLFVAPGRLMDNVKEDPRWWHPGLLIFLLIIGFTYIVNPISAPEQLELMKDSKIMSMAPEEVWQEQYQQSLNISPMKNLTTAVGAGFTTWILIIVFAYLLGFFTRMSGGQGTFKQALGVVSWASIIPFGLASLVKLPLVLQTESMVEVNLGLVALAPGADPGSALFAILSSYGDFLTWWGLVVLVIGFERVFAMNRSSAAVSVLLPWALATAIPVGLTLILM
jgi:hypothetical protein